MYKILIVPILGVVFLLLGVVNEARAQQRIQRIDREIQKTVFTARDTGTKQAETTAKTV